MVSPLVAPRQLPRLFVLLRNRDGTGRTRFSCQPAGGDQWPFERAQLRLDHGEWLRRRRRISDAKPVLTQALGTFRRLGARSWAQRAQAELRACGWRSPARPPNPGGQGFRSAAGRFQGAVGGPEQARLAVAFGLGGDPAGRPFEGWSRGGRGWGGCCFRWGCRSLVTACQSRVPWAPVVLRSW